MEKKKEKVSMNRQPLESSALFAHRGTNVKWPTIRKAWLTDHTVAQIKNYVTGTGRSIIFLDGTYDTNLNRYVGKDSTERAVFFEFMVKHPKVKGAIFVLCWIGNFHNGSIIHFAWQYPQVKCWEEAGQGTAEEFFERSAFNIYRRIVNILYDDSEYSMDHEVAYFLEVGQNEQINYQSAAL